jgi:hypothetical protein
MKNNLLSFLAKISLVIFAFLLLYYFVQGVTTKVWEVDSIGYHIPISRLILSGKILNPGSYSFRPNIDLFADPYRLYQPGSSEIILSIFNFLKIPLNLFGVAGVILFFFAMRALAKSYDLSDNLSIIFATSLATLHTVIRWIMSQTIDVWLAAFFGLSIVFLRRPVKSYKHFLILGITLGMLFGSKYTGPAYTMFLLILYGKETFKLLNLRRLLAFLTPFSVLGLSWYIRNYVLTGDPYFPQTIPFFKGIDYHILDEAVWKMFIYFRNGPIIWLHAFISEYTVWCLVVLVVPILYFLTFKNVNRIFRLGIQKLIFLALLSFTVYLFLPSGPTPSLITSVFRYTYPAFIPCILALFIYAKKFAKEEFLAVIAVTNMLIVPELSYHPKILIALVPVALAIFYPSKIKKLYEFIKERYSRKRI